MNALDSVRDCAILNGTVNIEASALVALTNRLRDLVGFAEPTPTRPFWSPTTTSALKLKRRPPLTTLATRLIATILSTKSVSFCFWYANFTLHLGVSWPSTHELMRDKERGILTQDWVLCQYCYIVELKVN